MKRGCAGQFDWPAVFDLSTMGRVVNEIGFGGLVMNKTLLLLASIGLAVSAAQSKTVNVFFAGGQSNAKAQWASAIASGLQAGYGSTLVMAHSNHSGNAMSQWFTTVPQANYRTDFWNASGTGFLQTQIHAITNAGDTAVLQGIFWFQGEGDTASNAAGYATMDAYTNRFLGMLSQLKTDLGITNEIRFTLAIIDAKPGATYDNDLAAIGRTRESVDYLRTNQIEMCSGPRGAYVDTRGYLRSDVWHLLMGAPDELSRLGLDMSAAYTNKFGISPPPEETVVIASHAADGCIYAGGAFDIDQICGITASNAYNGIAFFQLPTNRIDAANLSFTVVTDMGVLSNANIDVWGLGYMAAPALSSSWMLLSDADTRSPLNPNIPATKIADNLVTAGQATPANSVWQLNAQQRTNLTAFLNMLYQKGAVPGDYAVIRTNPDAALSGANAGVRWGGSGQTAPDRRVKLTVTLADAPAPSVTEGVFQVYSHANDGGIFSNGTSTANDLISGTGGTGTQDYNGVAFFALPEQPMTSVSLTLPVVTFSGVMSGANIDVWGLGYMASPALTTAWFCTNDVDSRLLLNGYPPVKLADNIVTSGQTSVSGNVWRPTVKQAEALRWYLNGLYNRGAKPGDYAVIRVNMDAKQGGVSRGVRWGGSQQASPNNRAMLQGVFPMTSNYLVNAGFESGMGPTASNWSVLYNNFLGQRTNVSVRSGENVFRFAVNGYRDSNTNNNNINIYQPINNANLAGKIVTFSGYARHDSVEPLVTNTEQKVEFRLWWLINGAQTGGYIDSAVKLLPADPLDTYKLISVVGVAPTNASGVGAQVIFRTGTVANPAITNGAAIVDDLRLIVLEPAYPPHPVGTLFIMR